MATIVWNRWSSSRVLAGHHGVESVVTFPWNRWPSCRGFGGHHTVESLATFPWNPQGELSAPGMEDAGKARKIGSNEFLVFGQEL